jgi:regulator of nonsense transcripts 2
MLKAAKDRYNDLPLVASLSAGLSRYHPSFGVALPDALLEEVGRASAMAFAHGAHRLRVQRVSFLNMLPSLGQEAFCIVRHCQIHYCCRRILQQDRVLPSSDSQ